MAPAKVSLRLYNLNLVTTNHCMRGCRTEAEQLGITSITMVNTWKDGFDKALSTIHHENHGICQQRAEPRASPRPPPKIPGE